MSKISYKERFVANVFAARIQNGDGNIEKAEAECKSFFLKLYGNYSEESSALVQSLKARLTADNELARYERLLVLHDWSYEYSDDNRRWRQGSREHGVLKDLQSKLDPEKEIWGRYEV